MGAFPNTNAEFSSLDEIQSNTLASLMTHGERIAPRGLATLEIAPFGFTLRHPRRRYISTPPRRWSLPLAIGEFSWHAAASSDVNFISYYARRWASFSEDAREIKGSCYGKTIFGSTDNGPSNWLRLYNLLRKDPSSRRAIIYFGHQRDPLDPEALDVACATSIQFLIRKGKLDAIVHMRSNDAIWGLPYDVFLFTMVQELMACELGLDLGKYHHFAGSMHLYERHFKLAETLIETSPVMNMDMPRITQHAHLDHFLNCEAAIRTAVDSPQFEKLDNYWSDFLTILRWFRSVKLGKGIPRTNFSSSSEDFYAPLLENYTRSLRRFKAA